MTKVALKISSIHGRGLFALQPIARGEEFCYYGGRRILRPKLRASKRRDGTYDIFWDQDHTLVGFRKPSTKFPARVAQFANDGAAILERDAVEHAREQTKHIARYYLDTRNNSCFHYVFDDKQKPKRIVLTATRDIAANEELFVCYEASYWTGRFRDPDTRVLYQIAEACFEGLVDWLLPAGVCRCEAMSDKLRAVRRTAIYALLKTMDTTIEDNKIVLITDAFRCPVFDLKTKRLMRVKPTNT